MYVALSEYPWMPTIVSNFLCFTICFLTNSDCYTMDELEFTHLTQGEEVEALEFFYTTWAEADDMDVPTEVPAVPKELVSLLESSTSLVARYKGEMVAQMLGEIHKREEVVGRKFGWKPVGTPWTPWALYKMAWGARLVTLEWSGLQMFSLRIQVTSVSWRSPSWQWTRGGGGRGWPVDCWRCPRRWPRRRGARRWC